MRRTGDATAAWHRSDREGGQATVEFALILLPLLLIVAGIIQFGIGLNYWLDMQRIANQGARWAVVNNWPPDCPRTATSCNATPACTGTRTAATLQNTLSCQIATTGLRGTATVKVCYPNANDDDPGNPVMVDIAAPFKFVPILQLGTITLRAEATMRLEQRPTLVTGEVPYNTTTKRCT